MNNIELYKHIIGNILKKKAVIDPNSKFKEYVNLEKWSKIIFEMENYGFLKNIKPVYGGIGKRLISISLDESNITDKGMALLD